jgi:allantoicase
LAYESTRNCDWTSACGLAWDSVNNSAKDLDWDLVWVSIRASVELLIIDNKDFKEKYPNGAFTQLFKLWEMGLYPV